MDDLKKKRAISKGQFTRKVKVLEQRLKDGDPHELLDTLYSELKDIYQEIVGFNKSILSILHTDATKYATEIKDADEYMDRLERKKLDLHSSVLKYKSNVKLPSVKVKSLPHPTFNGDLRKYGTFTKDYDRLMVPIYGRDPYALYKCLEGDAVDCMKGVEDGFDSMIIRLQTEYGNPCKVTDSIIKDIKDLGVILEGDHEKFVFSVNVLERAWLDMSKLNLQSEMNTTSMVTLVEGILPRRLLHDWVKVSESVDDKSVLFERLLEFLLQEKRICQYMASDDRSNKVKSHNGKSDIKLSSHTLSGDVNKLDAGSGLDVGAVLKEIRVTQDQQNIAIAECVTNISKLMSSVPINQNNNPRFNNYTYDMGARNSCWLHQGANHNIFNCNLFKGMSDTDKFMSLKRHNVCFKCLRAGHISKSCRVNPNMTCDILTNGVPCGFRHNKLLHNVLSAQNNVNVSGNLVSRSGHMLMVNNIKCKFSFVNMLWDGGSDVSLITHAKAKELGLNGTDIVVSITKVGNAMETVNSKEYLVPISDLNGNTYDIRCCGIDEITKPIRYIDISIASEIFPCLNGYQMRRPFGDIDMLIGVDNCSLFPNIIDTKDNLQLMISAFGYVLRGSHPSITVNEVYSHVSVRIYHIRVNDLNNITFSCNASIKDELGKFFTIESMGVSGEPKCGSCRCGNCISGNQNCSLKEERELMIIQQGLSYDHINQKWSCKYPWIKDPYCLPNNYSQAKAMLCSTEKRLMKRGDEYCKAYQTEMENNRVRGVARKLSREERNNYKGPIFYIPHTEVLKPDSKSTPVRIVYNSSVRFCGYSLNDMWAKGPDVLNSLFGIILRVREHPIVFTCDLSKMYNQITLSSFDTHCHRFLWRDFDQSREPDHYVLTCATFGDKCAGIIAMLALKNTAEMFKEEYPEASKIILENSYVDDIIGGCNDLLSAHKLMNEINMIVSKGGFKIKHFLLSGSHPETADINIVKTAEDKILGVSWKLDDNCFVFKPRINFSPKCRGIHKEDDLTIFNFKEKFPTTLTRRMVTSVMASQYSPLGLICPLMLEGKKLLRELITGDPKSNCEWDDPVTPDMKAMWFSFFKSLFELHGVRFSTCIKPSDFLGNPTLIIFSDASFLAYGACAYIRYECSDGYFAARLLTAKCKMAPIKSLTIPRLELLGAVLSARLETSILKEMKCTFDSVIHVVDSAIVRSQIQKQSYGFGTFTSTRIAEIQNRTNSEDWWWISGSNNPADLLTRPARIIDLKESSVWQCGPQFLTLPVKFWPIKKDLVDDLPDQISVYTTTSNIHLPLISSVINLENYSCYYKMIRVTCRVWKAMKYKSFKKVSDYPTVSDITDAEILWIKTVQASFKSDWRTRFRRLGPMLDDSGIILVGQRIANWLKNNYNQSTYILLPANSAFTKLLVTSIHNTCHAGIETLLAKVQIRFWIPKVRNLLRSIQMKCVVCKKLRKEVAGQIMGQLPDVRLKPSPAFTNTALDLFGPFFIRDTVKRRTKSKAYGVLFNCMSSRAVYLDLIDGYSTKSFVDGFRRFISIRGCPKLVYSDCGSQLNSFNNELKTMMSELNLVEIQNCARKFGGEIKWTFTSAHAQWQNGVSEALIKGVKKSLVISIGDSILTFSQLQSSLFEIANIINQRPIGIKPSNDIDLGKYLCPNDLLLGRTTGNATCYQTNYNPSLESILEFNDNIVNLFWKKWIRDFWPSLIIRQKWHFEKRNLRVGDIVIFQDSNILKANWKLGEILIANEGKDNKVRDVSIRYKHKKDGPHYKGQKDGIVSRSAHRVVVILPVEER